MRPREFFSRIRPLVRSRLDEELRDFQWSAVSVMAKLWYGNSDLHYEIWSRGRLRRIELGLHFEADPLTNARLLAAFRANARAVQRALATARIEEWDRGWARVWEPIPLRTMNTEFASALAERISAYVIALEPILRRELPSDVAWSETEPQVARATDGAATLLQKAGARSAEVTAAAPSRASRRAR